MIGVIYIRSIVGIIAIAGMISYLGATDSIVVGVGGIVSLVYIDKNISGEE